MNKCSNNMTRKIFFVLVLGAGLLLGYSKSYAQSTYLSARNLSLGGGGTAYMTGYHAIYINPANIGLYRGNSQFMLGIPGEINVSSGGPLLNVAIYNKYFTKGYQLTGSKLSSALSGWFGSNTSDSRALGFNVSVLPIAYMHKTKVGTFGAALRFRTLGRISINKGLAEFMLRGLDQSYFSQSRPINFSEASYSIASLSISYAKEFSLGSNRRFYVGIAPKFIEGLTYFKTNFKSHLMMSGDTLVQHQFQYNIYTVGSMTNDFQKFYNQRMNPNQNPSFSDIQFNSLANGGIKGTGMGLDLGATYVYSFDGKITRNNEIPTHALVVSASITDIGGVNFKKNAQKFSASNTFKWDGLNPNYQQIDAKHDSSFSNYLNYVGQDSIARNIYGAFSPDNVHKIHASLPTMLHIGAYYKSGKLGLMFDYDKGMNKIGMNTLNSSLSLGAEYYLLSFLPLRVGYRTGGMTSNSFSLGTGIEFRNFHFDVGVMTVKNSQKNGYNLATAISSLILIF